MREAMKVDMEERDVRRVDMAVETMKTTMGDETMEDDVNKEATMEGRTNTLAVQLSKEDTTIMAAEEAMEEEMTMI